ncbi:hypothetical protein FRB95_012702 [Tulasnella sp. JGI-2019a]|nr:hypothetical protein FRB95_012702 [Tulasnella sp. JGI-2019a]
MVKNLTQRVGAWQGFTIKRGSRHLDANTATPPICRIPVEVLHMIFDKLKRRYLVVLLQTCRIMRSSVESHLYKHINLWNTHKTITYYKKGTLEKLLRTLKDRPDLARSVLSLRADLSVWGNYAQSVGVFSRRGSRVVRLFLRLRESWIKARVFQEKLDDDVWSIGTWSYLPLVGGSRLPSLTSLEFSSTCRVGTIYELMSLIRQCHFLEDLKLPCIFIKGSERDRVDWKLSSTDFPHLKTLIATLGDARKIVPGRQITSLELYREAGFESNPEIWRDLDRSTGPLTQISVPIYWPASSVTLQLKVLVENLKNIERFGLRGVPCTSYDEVATSLLSFTQLRRLKVHVGYPDVVPKKDIWDSLALACPNLQQLRVSRSTISWPFQWLYDCAALGMGFKV